MCSCSFDRRVVRIDGGPTRDLPSFDLPLNHPGCTWPDEFPHQLAHKGLGLQVQVSNAEFRQGLMQAVEKCLTTTASGREDLDEWLYTGKSNGIEPRFVALQIPPHTTFFVHAHPGIELVYLLEGSMHEVRLVDPVYIDRECVLPKAPYSLVDPKYRFERNVYQGGKGQWLVNQVGSVHQSFTKEEGCSMLAVWPGKYVIFDDDQLPEGVFESVNHRSQDKEVHQRIEPNTLQIESISN